MVKHLRNILWTILLGAVLLVIFVPIFRSCESVGSWYKIADGSLIIPKDSVDRWHYLLSLPPEVFYDTIYRDTGRVVVVYKDVPVPVPETDSTYSVTDTLSTPWFSAWHSLVFQVRLGSDSVLLSRWSYQYKGPTEIIKTVKEYIPRPIPYEIRVPASGYYFGIHTDISQYAYSLGTNFDVIRGRFIYGGYVERQIFFDDRKSVGIGVRMSYKIK